MKAEKKDRTLTLYLTGKIDLNNNEAVKNEILQNWHKSLCSELILDFSDVTYIASSGLRVIMQLSKDIRQGIKIVNVSQEVYDVFDVTGFTQIIPISKKKKIYQLKILK